MRGRGNLKEDGGDGEVERGYSVASISSHTRLFAKSPPKVMFFHFSLYI